MKVENSEKINQFQILRCNFENKTKIVIIYMLKFKIIFFFFFFEK